MDKGNIRNSDPHRTTEEKEVKYFPDEVWRFYVYYCETASIDPLFTIKLIERYDKDNSLIEPPRSIKDLQKLVVPNRKLLAQVKVKKLNIRIVEEAINKESSSSKITSLKETKKSYEKELLELNNKLKERGLWR